MIADNYLRVGHCVEYNAEVSKEADVSSIPLYVNTLEDIKKRKAAKTKTSRAEGKENR